MARYETYQSNAAELPIMRKWLVRAFFLSLLLHGILIVVFHLKTLEHFGMDDTPRLAPPTEVLTRVKIPPMTEEETKVSLPATQPKPSKFTVPDDKPELQDVQIQTPVPDMAKPLMLDKPKVEPGAQDALARVEAASKGALEKELNSLAGNLIKESPVAPRQPALKLPSSSKSGDGGFGSGAGIPGRQSLDEALARVGPLPAGNKPIGMPGGALYEYDSAELRQDAIEQLRKLAELIRRNPNATFSIEGHTDSFGGEQYNQDLSLRRADSVRNWLIQNMNIAPDRIQTRGLGNTHWIVAPGKTVDEQAPNRRVEIVIRPNRKK